MKLSIAIVIVGLLGETFGFALVQPKTSRPVKKIFSVTPKRETETSESFEEAYLEIEYEGFFDGTKVRASVDNDCLIVPLTFMLTVFISQSLMHPGIWQQLISCARARQSLSKSSRLLESKNAMRFAHLLV